MRSCNAMAFFVSRRLKVSSGEYRAPVGQISHVLQRLHSLRPSYGTVFLAWGVAQNGIPLCSAQPFSCRRFHDSGIAGMG